MARGVRYNAKVWEALRAKLEGVAKATVRVGVLEGTHVKEDGGEISMVELALIHEFGSPAAKIPERSFIRRTFNNRAAAFAEAQARVARAIITGGMPVRQALNLLGTWMVNEIKKTITGEHIPPPLKPRTIARKKSDRPLVDTGQLLNSITHEIDEG